MVIDQLERVCLGKGGGGQGFNRLRANTDYLIFAPHLDMEALNDEFYSKNIEW